jgi:hypothetical protein
MASKDIEVGEDEVDVDEKEAKIQAEPSKRGRKKKQQNVTFFKLLTIIFRS